MAKRQITIMLNEELVRELEEIKKVTGLSLSKIIELKLRGYDIVKREDRIRRLILEELCKGMPLDEEKALREFRKSRKEAWEEIEEKYRLEGLIE